MTTATAPAQLDKDNPWPGLQFFDESAHAFFFGRHREIQSLLNHVLEAPVTVLYGRSGLGKTSLLQAGLFPVLREHNFLPIHVRFALKPGAAELTRQLQRSVHDSIRAEVPHAALPSDEESVWEYLHHASFELWSAQNYPLTSVIVLDQFEELFTLGKQVPDLVDDFRDELGDLAENRIPTDLCTRIDNDAAVAEHYDLRSRKYRLLISLREDFLPDLEAWCRLIPALGRSRVRLLPLRVDDALDAVHEPAKDLMTKELAGQVVRTIAGQDLHRGRAPASPDAGRSGHQLNRVNRLEVEPALLSLFCRELNEERKRSGQDLFDERLLKHAERDVLSNFYESCVRDLRPQVAVFIEEHLITESGFRDNYVRADAVPAHLTQQELDQLIGSRLVRLEDRLGAQRIELTHDVLTGVVLEHRDLRRAREKVAEQAEQERKAQAYAAEQREAALDRERLDEREKRLQSEQERRLESERAGRRFKRLSVGLAVACIVAVVFAALMVNYKLQADQNAREAADAARQATAARLAGDSLRMLNGLSPASSDDVAVMQKVLAADAIPSPHPGQKYELLTVLNQERDLLKIIDAPAAVTSVAFSPDGTRVAIASADKTVQLWQADTWKPIGPPVGTDATVKSLAFSPDGTRLATASADNTARLWDTNGQPIGQAMRHDGAVLGVAFSPDGTRLATASADNTARLWDANGQPIGQAMRHDGAVLGVAFSPDGTRLATASADNTARLWNTDGRPIGLPMPHGDLVNGLAFSPDGSRLATATANALRLWDTRTQQEVRKLRPDGGVTSVAFNPNGTRIATGGIDTTIRLWDVSIGSEVGSLRGHEAPVTALVFQPGTQHLMSSGGSDRTVRLWDTSSQPMPGYKDTPVQPQASVPVPPFSARFFDDGRRIGSGSWNKAVRWWDASTGQPIGKPLLVDDSDVEALFPVGQDRLLSFGRVDTARLWDGRTRTPMGAPLRLPLDASGMIVADDTTTPRIAARLEPGVVQVFGSDTMQPVRTQIRPAGTVSTLNFSPDGRILATGVVEGVVQLWDPATGESVGPPMTGDTAVQRIAFSRDTHLLAAGYADNTLQLWDTSTSQRLGNPIDLGSRANVLAVDPAGRTVASGGADGTIQLFDVSDHSRLGGPLTGSTAPVTSLQFSPDGTKLLSASSDGAVRLGQVPAQYPDAARDMLCAKLTHNPTEEQWKEWVSADIVIPFKDACTNLPRSEYAPR